MIQFTPAFASFRVENRSTVYELSVASTESDRVLIFATGASTHYGEWVKVPDYLAEISWSYLIEKCPALAKHGGEKEGWMMVLKQAGIEVFG